ncbi:MAG: hypothetical protein ACREDX_04110, partial [Aestuariivirga sp.]
DFIYPGPLYAQIPGADLAAYLETAEALLTVLQPDATILCAHGQPDTQGKHRAPRLARSDVAGLAASLVRLRESGEQPKSWPINEAMTLLTWEPAFAAWQSSRKSI